MLHTKDTNKVLGSVDLCSQFINSTKLCIKHIDCLLFFII